MVFAGLTVIIALVGLLVANISFITEMGVAAAFAILVSVLMALTLLPVLMRTLGRRVLPKKERTRRTNAFGTPPDGLTDVQFTARDGFLRRWGTFVVAHPLRSLLAGVVVLVIVAAPILSMKTAFSIPGGADPTSTQRTAYNLIIDEFGGVQSPLVVLAEADGDVTARAASVQDALAGLPGVQMVVPGPISADGNVALLTVIPAEGPIDQQTKDLVQQIRTDADSVSGVHLEVTGETAIGIDQDQALQDALIRYLIVIVVISLVLLIVMFRSLLIPLIATLGYLLSVGASFGASVAVFQWGWLDPLIPAPQGDPMMSILPILLVGVLFGLAMDYQVFLVSRIQEMHNTGMSPKQAIFRRFLPLGSGPGGRSDDHDGRLRGLCDEHLPDRRIHRLRTGGRGDGRRLHRSSHPDARTDVPARQGRVVAAKVARSHSPERRHGRPRTRRALRVPARQAERRSRDRLAIGGAGACIMHWPARRHGLFLTLLVVHDSAQQAADRATEHPSGRAPEE
ncbi:MMPL family transporter [Cryobacterium breve]|uniref:MMPL family transporter n=1 Tax=Cryobacterium breve TaxID=1259258 RepID=UPI003D7C31E4